MNLAVLSLNLLVYSICRLTVYGALPSLKLYSKILGPFYLSGTSILNSLSSSFSIFLSIYSLLAELFINTLLI